MKGYRISVLRHGMTEANEKGVYIGSTDLPLSDKGAAELAAKADEYDYPRVHRVYSSPLRRCTETAEILFPDTELCTVDDLRELNFGEFENKSIDELAKRKDYNDWLRGGKDARPPKGESLEEMTARTYKAVHSVITDMMENGLTHCAIITHGGIISNMLSCFGLPKYDAKTLSCDFGMGFDIIVTAQMWLNSQAFEILGYCPYDRLPSEEDE
ncbi:histidine phosphatase family protein [Ruminococcus flavefaciens]|uniref:Alpha-ribazole phosphatase n=1 Tax=Ruminococcus flavefaciens TaxID=1265 RepID=A0A315Y0M6_RUMFL|nr:histidine phosphatase family protein [Ruminococcus flavefaciens]PWJ13380.1 alpha-ribazole phosphatase [Ruminococcus flavefaciens]SSA47871.1 alpha-ribazole phosphatase [Ruminococcus flavefaciens]